MKGGLHTVNLFEFVYPTALANSDKIIGKAIDNSGSYKKEMVGDRFCHQFVSARTSL